jgi:putative exosortase-associated protein (TIGR04073 family)
MKKQSMLTLAALAVLALGTAPAAAQSSTYAGDGRGQTYVAPVPAGWEAGPGPELGMGRKFGRGVVNVLTFWTEIPRNVALEWQRTDPASGFFLGVGKGVGYGYARLMAGIYDIVTFPAPVPMGYAPVMQPEFTAENPYREVATGHELIVPLTPMPSQADLEADRAVRPSRQWP